MDWLFNRNNTILKYADVFLGYRHILLLLSTVGACIGLTLFLRRKNEASKRKFFKVIAWVLIGFELSYRVINLLGVSEYSLKDILEIVLPLHLCSIMVWVLIVAFLTEKEWLLRFGTVCTIMSMGLYLIFPLTGLNQAKFSFSMLYSASTHEIGFVSAVLLLTLKSVEFSMQKIWQTFLGYAVCFVWGGVANVVYKHRNYMFMAKDPLSLPLPFPYQILYAVLVVGYIVVFFLLARKIKTDIKKKKEQT